ncbi:hypothetical protein SELMODRAFT_432639 [Selaginella moellendorffii]|uniref:O-acyltransferase WSD1 C-terminal domain-containing protein n=1 Tax=Selaginella moellendorffii TaxID=88036 RepID=D8TGM0_SELML|nr:uncharacterized protein LOC9652944 [Selaginella moellendorffii]EFJ04195.1 hypothetical protein SELMODRAFT_432639 [Selaginella moellendorffii]|eukprot:XP_002994738.1 uncharacterized protein LOC9652944 [Selaginella moellendorffii]
MAAAATVMKRELGSSEENWTRCTAGGTGIGIFGMALRQIVQTPSILLAAKAVCENHSMLRAQLVPDAKSSSKKLAFEVRSVDSFAPVVESLPWPEEGTLGSCDGDEEALVKSALQAVVTNELNLPFHKEHKELDHTVDIFQIHVYEEASSGSSIIVLRFHSGACDRYSSSTAAQEFVAALDRCVEAGVECERQEQQRQDRDGLLPCMEDLVPKSKASKGFFKKGIDAVGYALNSSKSALLPFQPGFTKQPHATPFRSEILSYSLGKPGTEDFFAACKRESTTIAAALSAAFLKTAASVTKEKKQDTFSFTNVLDCRGYFEPPLDASVVGNYSAGLPHDEQVKEGVPFWDLARQISSSTEKNLAKSRHFSELSVLNMLLSQVIKHPSVTPSSSMRTALFTVFVDGPTKCSWGNVKNLKLAGTIGPLASMHYVGPCFSVAEALLDGPELSLTFVYTTPMYSRSQLQDLVSSSLDLLKSAVASN